MSSISINTSVSATFARQKSKESQNDTSQKLEEMASGLSIDSKSSESSDVSVSTEAESQLLGGTEEIQSLQNDLSKLQTARDGNRQVQQNLQELREVASGAVESEGSDENQGFRDEANRLLGAIEETVSEAQFNGEALLDGDSGGAETTVSVETGNGQTQNVSLGDLSPDALGIEDIDLSTPAGAGEALETLNGVINQVATEGSGIDEAINDLANSIDSGLIQRENEAAARSQIRDSDLARESTRSAQSSILNQAETSAFAQANNLEGSSALQLLE